MHPFHDEEKPRFGFADVVDGDDVGVIQSGSGARLSLESLDGNTILHLVRGQEFQSDHAAKARVLSPVNLAHAAPAQLGRNAVVGYSPAYHPGALRGLIIAHLAVPIAVAATGFRGIPRPTTCVRLPGFRNSLAFERDSDIII